MEILDELLGAFHAEVMAIIGACTLSSCEFRACGAPTFSREKDPISSRKWLADIDNAFMMSFCLEESKVRFASCLLKDMARDW